MCFGAPMIDHASCTTWVWIAWAEFLIADRAGVTKDKSSIYSNECSQRLFHLRVALQLGKLLHGAGMCRQRLLFRWYLNAHAAEEDDVVPQAPKTNGRKCFLPNPALLTLSFNVFQSKWLVTAVTNLEDGVTLLMGLEAHHFAPEHKKSFCTSPSPIHGHDWCFIHTHTYYFFHTYLI